MSGDTRELELIRDRLATVADPAGMLEGFFAFAPFGLQVYRADGRCLVVNRAFRELFGSEPPPEYNVLADEIAERSGVLAIIHRAFAGETVQLPVTWYDPRDLEQVRVEAGRRVAIAATFFPLRGPSGDVEHVAVVFKDVTAETRAAERVTQLHEMTSGLSRAVTVADVGRVATAGACRALGAACAAVFAMDFTRAGSAAPVMRLVDCRGNAECLVPVVDETFHRGLASWRTEDGRTTATVPLVLDGRALGAVILHYDVEHAPDDDERALVATIAHHIAQAIERARLLETEQRLNQRLRLLVRLGELLSRPDVRIAAALDEVAAAVVPAFADVCTISVEDEGGAGVVVSRGTGQGALVVPLAVHGARFGRMTFFSHEAAAELRPEDLSFAEEVGVRVALAIESARSYQAAREAARAAEDANRTKDEFLSVVSHELRTPLNAITGWARMLTSEDAPDPALVRRGLSVIRRNADAQTTIIDDILDVSRIITGKLRISLHPVDLVRVVQAAVETLRPAAIARQLEVSLSLEPGTMVMGDFDRLQQIAWNLLSNAIKFTPPGGRVSVELARDASSVLLRVRDEGRGIEARDLPYVFDRFRQVDASTTRSHGGLGLGLSIVRHIAEMHGGRVAVTSDGLSKGATFVVELPSAHRGAAWQAEVAEPNPNPFTIAPPTAAPESPRSATTLDAPVETSPRPMLDGVRVLVVDDERDAVELVSLVLRREGAQVRGASSVKEAFEVLDEFAPDVVATDIGMPIEDGFVLISRLRDLPSPRGEVPAIALTAYARPQDVERTTRAGFQMHMSKPLDPARLASAVAKLAHRPVPPNG